MQARKITLIEIGAGPMPSVTPVPLRESSWFPIVYVSPDVPPVEGVVPNPVADGVLIEWDAVDQEGVIYIIERGPTAQGPWTEIARVVETRYLYSDGSGQEWWFKITASVRGKPGEGAVVVAKPPQTVQDILDLFAEQAQQAADMAAGFAGQAAQIASLEAAISAADYDPAVGYGSGAVVKWQGGLYYALVETLGNLPSNTTYWRKIGEYDSLAEAVGAQALLIASQQTRMEQTEDALAVVAEQANAVAAALPGKANAGALDALASRVDQTEDGISSNAQAIAAANSEIQSKASSQALSALSSTVAQHGEALVVQSDALTAVTSRVGHGGNLIPNASLEQDTYGWAPFYTPVESGGTAVRDRYSADTPPGMHTLSFVRTANHNDSYIWRTPPFAIEERKKYLISCWVATRGAPAVLGVQMYKPDGTSATIYDSPKMGGFGGQTIGDFRRISFKVEIPAGYSSAWILLAAGAASAPNSYNIFMRPQMEEVGDSQVEPSPWGPGSAGIDARYASATQALEARTTINENGLASYFASWTMSLDANGRVAGIRSVNNGTTSTIDFLFDKVRFVSPGSGRRMEYSDGHFLGYDENNVRRLRLGTWSA